MADNATKDDYVVSTFKLYAEIEGFGKVEDVVSISGTFALNTIPKASLTLAAGINALTGAEASAHRILANVKMRAKVDVFLEVETTDGKIEQSPSQKIKVFEGYYAGFGFQRAQDNAQYTMHLVHWLDDLNIGSMMTRNFFPGSPYSFAESANAWTVLSDGFTNNNNSGIALAVPALDAKKIYTRPEKIEKDMWEETLKPILKKVAGFRSPDSGCADVPQDTSKAIENALNRMNGGPNKAKLPLKIRDSALNENDVATAVSRGLSQTGLAGYHYSTFWSTLVGMWAPNFFFAVSPSVEYANVFPYFGGLQFEPGKFFKTIKADDYSYANFMCNTGTILEGVDIFWQKESNTGAAAGTPANQDVKRATTTMCFPLGLFPPRGQRDHRGTILIKEPPFWVNFVSYTAHSVESLGLASQRVGDTSTGTESGNAKPANGEDRAGQQASIKQSKLLDRFAEHWYKHEFLQNRYGELSGKLRFDIAPGSIVKIEAPKRTMPELADNKTDMIGMVAQVSFVINAELANAGTAFSLTNLRSELEDKDPLKTSKLPPLYADKWAGGPLVT